MWTGVSYSWLAPATRCPEHAAWGPQRLQVSGALILSHLLELLGSPCGVGKGGTEGKGKLQVLLCWDHRDASLPTAHLLSHWTSRPQGGPKGRKRGK